MTEGDYKYHSPEVIWEGGFEDPKTGEVLEGPMIVGDALLHTPHLGEATALYSVTQKQGDETMGDTVAIPEKVWDKFMTLITPPEKEGMVEGLEVIAPEVDVEEFDALMVERDDYKAKIESMEAKEKLQEKMSAITGEFDTEEFGAAYQELAKLEDAVEILSGMEDKERDWILVQFKALSKQINESALIKEKGTTGAGIDEDDVVGQLNAVVEARAKEDKISYAAALQLVSNEQPELVGAYQKEEK